MQADVTVSDILASEVFRSARVLGGHVGLDKVVRRITVAELPDNLDWFQGGELVCSTAYHLKDHQEALHLWIDGLVERNAVALAIKPDRFLGDLSAQMIERADWYGFPLISVPFDVTWSFVIDGVMNLIVERQLEQFRRSQEVYSRLTQLALNSQGLANIVKAIAELVENPVILEDCCLNLLTLSWPGLREDGHPYLEHRLSAGYIQRLQRSPFLSNTLLGRQKTVLREVLTTPAGPVEQVIWPVIAGREVLGFLTILLAGKKDRDHDLVTLEHGSNIIALELLKERTTLEAVGRTQADLLHYVLESEHVTEEELKRKAALLGINLTKPTGVLVIHCEMPGASVSGPEQAGINLTGGEIPYWVPAWVERTVQTVDPSARVIGRDRDIVVFFSPSGLSGAPKFLAEAKTLGNTIIRGLQEKHPGLGVLIGIGRPYVNCRQIQRSYREARTVLNTRPFLGPAAERVLTFPEIGVYRFLSVIKDSDELEAFWRDLIGKLVEYDRRHGAKLTETLETFLRSNENQAETARRLFVHVNSLNYRLQRIGELLAVDLRDAETRLLLHLAIMIYKSRANQVVC